MRLDIQLTEIDTLYQNRTNTALSVMKNVSSMFYSIRQRLRQQHTFIGAKGTVRTTYRQQLQL